MICFLTSNVLPSQFWPLRMELLATLTPTLWIGGRLVLSCLSAWLDTLHSTLVRAATARSQIDSAVAYPPVLVSPDDPVTTCRKILRWRQCLEMPAETKAQLSPECIDFLSCLLAGPESRIGSNKNGNEIENGFQQVVQHPWFRGFDWDGLREKEGPLLPSGSREFPELLEYLK